MDSPVILVVDDDRDTRELYGLVFEVSGYGHVEADGVENAVEVARRVRPDVILTDWMLGDGDGIALCESLHRHGRTRRTPIIAVTGMSLSPKSGPAPRQLGCEMFLIKPVDVDALVRAVSNTLQIAQARSLRAAAVRLRRYARAVCESVRTRSGEHHRLTAARGLPGASQQVGCAARGRRQPGVTSRSTTVWRS